MIERIHVQTLTGADGRSLLLVTLWQNGVGLLGSVQIPKVSEHFEETFHLDKMQVIH